MRFKGLDLNLLLALDVLIHERSVSRAAERLRLSQPAMSAALNRLRKYFDDPLLAPNGSKMIPTPHAVRLQVVVRELLSNAETIVSSSTAFDPAVSRRRFRIGVSDYLAIVLFTELVPTLEKISPHIYLDLVQPSDSLAAMLEQGELDLIITLPEYLAAAHPRELLLEERHVVAGWKDNPIVWKRITEKQFFEAGHLAVEIGRTRPMSFAETHLRRMGRQRRIQINVSSFAVAPEMLINTHRLAVMHERLARAYAKRIPLTYVEMPFKFPLMQEFLQYHQVNTSDVGLRWLIAQIRLALDRT